MKVKQNMDSMEILQDHQTFGSLQGFHQWLSMGGYEPLRVDPAERLWRLKKSLTHDPLTLTLEIYDNVEPTTTWWGEC